VSHLLHHAQKPMSAFIGGIAKNMNSNVIIGDENDEVVVMEADEFDRSFLQITPYVSIVTSIDADHLDIYGDEQQVVEAFDQFVDICVFCSRSRSKSAEITSCHFVSNSDTL
jgi:UDP-N-acetylmuramate--alanine ligase